jgi:hypothetical protein
LRRNPGTITFTSIPRVVVADADPAIYRAVPRNWVAADKQKIARVKYPLLGSVDQNVAARVRGAKMGKAQV